MRLQHYFAAAVCACCACLIGRSEGAPERDTLVIFRFSNGTADSSLNHFHLLLRKQFEYELLFPDLAIEASGATFETGNPEALRSRFAVHGRFDPDSATGEPAMTFRIDDLRTGVLHQKKIALQGMSPDDLARIVILKSGNHLREKTLGKLNISSTPAGCMIMLDNVRTGLTPKEFSLQPGRYTLELTSDFLSPFKGEVDIVEGKPVNLNIHMNFKGYPTLHWLAGAFVCTGLSMITFVVEREAYREYESSASPLLDPPSRNSTDGKQYRAYRNARWVRLAFQQGAVAGWTGTGFCFFINTSIQKRIFGRKN